MAPAWRANLVKYLLTAIQSEYPIPVLPVAAPPSSLTDAGGGAVGVQSDDSARDSCGFHGRRAWVSQHLILHARGQSIRCSALAPPPSAFPPPCGWRTADAAYCTRHVGRAWRTQPNGPPTTCHRMPWHKHSSPAGSSTLILNVKCDKLLSSFATNFNLRHYTKVSSERLRNVVGGAAAAHDTCTASWSSYDEVGFDEEFCLLDRGCGNVMRKLTGHPGDVAQLDALLGAVSFDASRDEWLALLGDGGCGGGWGAVGGCDSEATGEGVAGARAEAGGEAGGRGGGGGARYDAVGVFSAGGYTHSHWSST